MMTTVLDLQSELQALRGQHRSIARMRLYVSIGAVSILLSGAVAWYMSGALPPLAKYFALAIAIPNLIVAYVAMERTSSRQASLLASVDGMNDPTVAGLLIDAMVYFRADLRQRIAAELKAQLPRMAPDDGVELSSSQVDSIGHLLANSNDEGLVRLLLSAVSRKLVLSALPYVQQLDEDIRRGRRRRSLLDATADCLRSLEQRAKQAREESMLLRGASAVQDAALRAAGPPSGDDESTLLRSTAEGR